MTFCMQLHMQKNERTFFFHFKKFYGVQKSAKYVLSSFFSYQTLRVLVQDVKYAKICIQISFCKRLQ